jgi:hypothetical protein
MPGRGDNTAGLILSLIIATILVGSCYYLGIIDFLLNVAKAI